MRLKKWQLVTLLVLAVLDFATLGIGFAIVAMPTLSRAASISVTAVPPQTAPVSVSTAQLAQTEYSLPPLNQGATLELAVDLTDGTHPVIVGRTNLPDGTLLMLSIASQSPFAVKGQDKVTVNNGNFKSGLLGPQEGLPQGDYTAYATMPYPHLQPASVRAVIGEKGEKLVGPLVERNEVEATISAKKEFRISTRGGGNTAAQEVYGHMQCNREKTWIAISQTVLEEYLRANLEQGYQLTVQGKVFLVNCGTSVKIIDRVQNTVKLQILEGEYKDRIGWTTTNFVKVP